MAKGFRSTSQQAAESFMEELREEVASVRPAIPEIYEASGDQSTLDYLSGLHNPQGFFPDAIATTAITELASRWMTPSEMQRIERSLRAGVSLNVADHAGFPFHADWLQANLANVIGAPDHVSISAPTSLTSMHNLLGPGRVSWGGYQANLPPRKYRKKSVVAVPALSRENYETRMPPEIVDLIPFDALAKGSFVEQSCSFNTMLWRELGFLDGKSVVAFMSSEALCRDLLMLNFREGDLWAEALGSARWIVEFRDALKNMTYGWFDSGKGSELFWQVDETKMRIRRLEFDGTHFRNDNMALALGEPLERAIAEMKVVPTSLLSFLVFATHGINQCGGINHVTYSPPIAERAAPLIAQIDGRRGQALLSYRADRFIQIYGLCVDEFGKKMSVYDAMTRPEEAFESVNDILGMSFKDVVEITAYPSILRYGDSDLSNPQMAEVTEQQVFAAKFDPDALVELLAEDAAEVAAG